MPELEELLTLPWTPDRGAASELLADPRTTGTTGLVLAVKLVGERLFEDPDTGEPMDMTELWMLMDEAYTCRVHDANENRINAMVLALTSDAFETEPAAFAGVCSSLSDGDLGDLVDGVFDPPTFDEVLWALAEIELMRDEPIALAPPVLKLLEHIAAEEDDSPDTEENIKVLVLERMQQLQDELRALGAPPALVDSIPRRMKLGTS